jgi:hypothetical protein
MEQTNDLVEENDALRMWNGA